MLVFVRPMKGSTSKFMRALNLQARKWLVNHLLGLASLMCVDIQLQLRKHNPNKTTRMNLCARKFTLDNTPSNLRSCSNFQIPYRNLNYQGIKIRDGVVFSQKAVNRRGVIMLQKLHYFIINYQ